MRTFKMQVNELYHHGIRGQKWGQRNGPPYPLSRKVSDAVKAGANGAITAYNTANDIVENQRHRKNMKLIERGSVKEVIRNVDNFNAEEMEAAKTRLKLYKEINDIKNSDKELGKHKLTEGLKTVAGFGTAAFSIFEVYDKFKKRAANNSESAKTLEQLKKELDKLNTENALKEATKKSQKLSGGGSDSSSKLQAEFMKAWQKQADEILKNINNGTYDPKDAASMKTLLENMSKIKKMCEEA